MRDRLTRVLWALRHPIWVHGPRCGASGPWRLPDCGTCIAPRGHEHHRGPSPDWHADGTGYIWNDVTGVWGWNGPTIDLATEYAKLNHSGYEGVFYETPTDPERPTAP